MNPLVLSLAAVLQVAPVAQEYSGRAGQLDGSPPRIESFEPSPGTIYFIRYSRVMDGQYGIDLSEKDLQQDGFFMKLSYLFRL